MTLLRKILLGLALSTGATGAITIAPAQVQAGEVIVYNFPFRTQADGETVRVTYYPGAPYYPYYPTYVVYKANEAAGPGWYICGQVN